MSDHRALSVCIKKPISNSPMDKSIKIKITTRRSEEFLKTVIWIYDGGRSSQEIFNDFLPKFINCFN